MADLDYEIDPKQYQLIKEIGQAYDGTATVYLAKYLPTQSFVAISRTNLDAVNEGFAVLQHEFYLMRRMQHENILAFNQAIITDNELWVVMPLMDLGSAREILDNTLPDGMPETAIAYIMRDVLMALDYIHRMGYVHRSVNASHIFLSKTGKVTLAGLRTAVSMVEDGKWLRAVHNFPTQAVKTLPWLAPEVLEQNLLGYDTKSDIYSVGITACELANGCVPFCDMVPMKMLLEKINGTTPKLLDSSTLLNEVGQEGSAVDSSVALGKRKQSDQNPFTRLFSPQFHQFVEDCLKQEPIDRPSASALLNHPFLKQVKKQTSEDLLSFLQSLTCLTSLTEMQPKVDQGAVESQDCDLVKKLQCIDIGESWVFD